jgi:uncharacterized protein YkwD
VVAAAPATAEAGTTSRMVHRLNVERARIGLGPLKVDRALNVAAARQSRRQLRVGRFEHASSLGVPGLRRVAELIARQPGWRLQTGSVARGWKNSPVHASLVESSSYRLAGVGWARGMMGGVPTTIWTVRLGER